MPQSPEELDVLVFLDQCDFIDSTGIAAIVQAHRSITGKGRRLLLCNPSGQVSRILAITGLSDTGLSVTAPTGHWPGEPRSRLSSDRLAWMGGYASPARALRL